MALVTDEGAGARPGRKRSQTSRLAILTATWDLLGEVGYARLSVEAIAARSGTGKQTIRRWWPSKADVVQEALASRVDLRVPVPDLGSYRADLRAFLDGSFALASEPTVPTVLRALMAHSQLDAAFSERFRATFLRQRREALGLLVARARHRQELPAHPTPEVLADLLFGVIWYRILATDAPLDAALATELVATLAGSAAGAGAAQGD